MAHLSKGFALHTSVVFVGEVGRLEVVERGLFAVTDTFVQRASNAVQTLVQFLAGVGSSIGLLAD